MTRGFVTIATGDDRYFLLARTLLRSYRENCNNPFRFALITDRRNEYTEEFDDVVVLEGAKNSWMDKMRLLDACPYDENLFIDADCLVYRDINFFWDLFEGADDFSCFGKHLPLDAEGGWFTNQAAEIYPIQSCIHLHGMLYFLRKSDTLVRMQTLCNDIIENYGKVQFKGFNDRLADEPVYALAMGVLGLHPVERKSEYYCFVPYATAFHSNYARRTVAFENPTDGSVDGCCVVHWGNYNTKRAQYRFDAGAVNGKKKSFMYGLCYRKAVLLVWFQLQDRVSDFRKNAKWFFGRVIHKMTGR